MKNYHLLQIKYLGATNYNGSRIKIISKRFEQSVTIPYDYKYDNTCEGATAYLESKGYEIIGKGEFGDSYILISTTFEPLK